MSEREGRRVEDSFYAFGAPRPGESEAAFLHRKGEYAGYVWLAFFAIAGIVMFFWGAK